MTNSSNKLTAIDELSQAIYSLTAADGRLRGRATRTLGAVSMVHAR
ncbi:MarR family transcriptional regulator, partial [Bacillus thuringiensis]